MTVTKLAVGDKVPGIDAVVDRVLGDDKYVVTLASVFGDSHPCNQIVVTIGMVPAVVRREALSAHAQADLRS